MAGTVSSESEITRITASIQPPNCPATTPLVRRSRRWFVPALVGVCAVAAVGYPLVIPWLLADPAFAAGALPFAILMIGPALASPYLPFAHLLLMAKRPGWHTVVLVAAIAVNLAATGTLIPRLGITGAAAAMTATTLAAALLLRGVARTRVGVRL
jgi:O-antigen/teichoic acid export membrane protein